ncbi:CRISPR-associated protein Csx20 [Clostridium sp. WLY-B-L2]|uniref:CRISPR-associated protein Csx20 n=1 Tax=Clostridium aromativorans TaxID=2836848 RepID=A0ABS8NA68_9CLOT|nr:CRISPR-associated protein Csx20 [Clostridium aromativorans]MCC9296707.1 CRISPR-associated protein Csx20 [Clostridium aromativorans]
MTKMFLLFSHKLLESQKEEAMSRFNVDKFIELPGKLRNKWSDVPSQGDIPKGYLDEIINFINLNKSERNYALVEGEYGIIYVMVQWCIKNKVIPLYAAAKRVYKSFCNSDGSISEIHIFKHVTFRLYKDVY